MEWISRRFDTGDGGFTFDISMQFAFLVEVLQAFEKFPNDDCNVFFAEDSGFHLFDSTSGMGGSRGTERTRSEHEPPEQYLYRGERSSGVQNTGMRTRTP